MSNTAHGRNEIVAYWIRERERIRIAKESGEPPPWTKDGIFNTYRFCNVRREDDRVTRWIRLHWRNPFHDHPNLTLAMAMARFVNWPPALEELGYPKRWSAAHFIKVMNARKNRGDQCWNAAYMISTCGAERGKAEHVAWVLERMKDGVYGPIGEDTLEMAHGRLMRVHGLGSFLAGQIVADLKHAPLNPLANAPDFWTWAAPGPGSERGLRWWLGREKRIAPFEFLPRLADLIRKVEPLVKGYVGPLAAQDWQNVCCEVSKYVKALNGGRLKQKYASHAEVYEV